jgi:hypothetical protein
MIGWFFGNVQIVQMMALKRGLVNPCIEQLALFFGNSNRSLRLFPDTLRFRSALAGPAGAANGPTVRPSNRCPLDKSDPSDYRLDDLNDSVLKAESYKPF